MWRRSLPFQGLPGVLPQETAPFAPPNLVGGVKRYWALRQCHAVKQMLWGNKKGISKAVSDRQAIIQINALSRAGFPLQYRWFSFYWFFGFEQVINAYVFITSNPPSNKEEVEKSTISILLCTMDSCPFFINSISYLSSSMTLDLMSHQFNMTHANSDMLLEWVCCHDESLNFKN